MAALALLMLGAGCAGQPKKSGVAMSVGGGCDLGGRTWQQTSPGPCGSSMWTFTRSGDVWATTETGCAAATGSAEYNGAVITMQFSYGGGAGVYTWPLDSSCHSKPGSVTWTSGPLTGQTVASTLAPAP